MGERTLRLRQAPPPSEPTRGVKAAGPRHRQLTQLATALNAAPRLPAEAAAIARGGSGFERLPERLRNGVEALSGIAMDDVRVHYDSPRPAQLQAHAFAQGGDIYLAPGQAHHLPHEAWHVTQQAQGRVKPTAQLMGGVSINDDSGLEREADAMGARAVTVAARGAVEQRPAESGAIQAKSVVQRATWESTDAGWQQINGRPGATPPTDNAPEEGMVYDDELDVIFETMDDYERALASQVFGAKDLPDDDLDDVDYDPDADMEEEEEEEEEDGGEPSDSDMHDSTEPDIETRRETDADALARPFETSPLDEPDARYQSRSMTSADKFRAGKVMGKRTTQSGSVEITLQTVALWVNDKLEMRERPIAVSGIVEPTSTTGRGGAPDPLSGYQVYSGGGKRPKASIASERNSGAMDVERGHVMALELGGPDIAENIVPQWAKFQGSGDWRKMEVAVLAKANALTEGQQLRYAVDIFYKSSGALTPTLRTFGFPSGFKATTQVIEGMNAGPVEVEFHQGQAQDRTDQMLSEREMSKLDGSDWDPGLDKEKPKGKKPRLSVKAVKYPDRAAVRKQAVDKQIANTKSKRQGAFKKRRNLADS